MNSELKSNRIIAQQLDKMFDADRMVHAVLFAGGSKDSRDEIGRYCARKVLCHDEISLAKFEHDNHEDFILVQKPDDRESIVVSQIDELVDKLQFKPYGDCFCVMIRDADLMRKESQNKILKTLEEPVSPCLMILLAERKESILPTVLSRCICFNLEETQNQYDERISAAADEFIALIKTAAPYYKKKSVLSGILSDKDSAREKALEFLDVLEEKLEMELLKGENTDVLSRAVRQAETGRQYLKQLYSVAYTLKQMCLHV